MSPLLLDCLVSFTTMSLYGGIKFSIGDDQKPLVDAGGNAEAKPLQVLGGGVSKDSTKKSYNDHPDEHPPAGGSKLSSKGPAQAPKPGKTSAALKFAPRIRQPKPVAGPSTTYAAEPVFIDTLQPTASSSTSQTKNQEVVFGNDGKALAKAPAMTLNAGKRERGKEDSERRKQKKKQRVRLFPSSLQTWRS